MQIGYSQSIILGVELEEQLILRLRHVVDGTGVCGIKDLLLAHTSVHIQMNPQVSLGDFAAHRAVSINPHGTEMHKVSIQLRFNNCREHIIGRVEIV